MAEEKIFAENGISEEEFNSKVRQLINTTPLAQRKDIKTLKEWHTIGFEIDTMLYTKKSITKKDWDKLYHINYMRPIRDATNDASRKRIDFWIAYEDWYMGIESRALHILKSRKEASA